MTEREDRSAVILGSHPLWVDGLERLLGRLGIVDVAIATTLTDAVALVQERRPDLLLLDIDGVDMQERRTLLDHLRDVDDVRIVMIANVADAQTVELAFAAGTAVFCTKAGAGQDLPSAVRQSFERSLDHAGARVNGDAPASRADAKYDDLTRRELEILRLVAEGQSNGQVAALLWVTEQTVKFHLSNIYRKLGVANRTEASRWAQLHGLLPLAPVSVATT
jgi:DNA-binding NarL/FixJ family response regulator